MTFKQCQGHETQNDNVDPKLGYNHAKFERSCFNGVRDKANIKDFSSFCHIWTINTDHHADSHFSCKSKITLRIYSGMSFAGEITLYTLSGKQFTAEITLHANTEN